MPAPKVDSAVVRIDLYKEPPVRPKDEKLFFTTVKAAFEQRRKTLENALLAKLPYPREKIAAAIASAGLPEKVRGERLSTEDFIRLSDEISAI